MPYVDLDGTTTYYEQHGSGEPVLLLHGGFCSIETWESQIGALAATYLVHAPERSGQGRTADRPGPMTYQSMVDDTIAYLDAMDVESAHVVGFSDGAIAGLMLALQHPGRMRSLVAISANLSPDVFGDHEGDHEGGGEEPGGDGAAQEQETEDEAEPDAEDEAYARLSPDGPEHRDVILEKLLAMWLSEPRIDPAELATVRLPTLILAGDRDTIPTEHTVEIAAAIPAAQLCIVPDAGHLVIRDRPDQVNRAIGEFLAHLG